MQLISQIAAALGNEWLPNVYRDKIRTQRTRSIAIEVPIRENECIIQHTLLGIELKVGRRRFACPDLSTARYMRVFARLGCRSFAIPYDITRVSAAADELETSWQKCLILLADQSERSTSKSEILARSNLIKTMRLEIAEIGPGELMPIFDRPTRSR
jgi:hypothetical protein